MKVPFRSIIVKVALVVACAPGCAFAQFAPSSPPVQAQLMSESLAVTPGFKFRIGVLFKIAPGWHIYWKNSGDAGLPTRVQFDAPADLKIGELLWPQHEEFELPGNIQGLGYSDSVLIFTQVTAADTLDAHKEQSIKAKASWLACSPKLCVPEEKVLELRLPVKPVPDFGETPLFDQWQSKLPL